MKIGIDIGGSHIAIAVVEGENIIDKREYVYDKEFKDNIRSHIESVLTNSISEFLTQYAIDKIGISIAGDLNNNVLYFSPNLSGLLGINFVEMLSQHFSIPISINKDSFCAGRAEKTYGCIKQYSDCVFLVVGTGIGAVSYYDNNIFRNSFGHMIIEKNSNRQCNCGKRGCFETYGSITALKKVVMNTLGKKQMSGKELHDYLSIHQNEKDIKEIIDNYVSDFCIGLGNIIHIILPEAIGFGGSFSYYEDILLNKIKYKLLEGNFLNDINNMPVLTIGKLKNDAGIIGATLF